MAIPEPEPEPEPDPPTPEPETLPRLAGADRYQTAAMLALQADPARRTKVYLATPDDAATAAAAGDGVVLLARPGHDVLPGVTAAALTDLAPAQVVVVGGSAAVTAPAARQAAAAVKEN